MHLEQQSPIELKERKIEKTRRMLASNSSSDLAGERVEERREIENKHNIQTFETTSEPGKPIDCEKLRQTFLTNLSDYLSLIDFSIFGSVNRI